MKTIVVGGGIGKNVAFSALLPKLANGEKVNVMTGYPDLFENNKHVRRSLTMMLPYGYEDYMKGQDVYWPEPYTVTKFFKRELHLIEAYAQLLEVDYDPETDRSQFPIIDSIWKREVDKLKTKEKDYVVVQFMGGKQLQAGQQGQQGPNFTARDYPLDLVSEFVHQFKAKFPSIALVNFGLPDEDIEGIITLGEKGDKKSPDHNCGANPNQGAYKTYMPYAAGAYLLQQANAFVGIDSSMQHMSNMEGVDTKGVVVWGSTDPKSFGYEKNVNLTAECPYDDLHCTRPYFAMSSDMKSDGQPWSCPTKDCSRVAPEVIMKELIHLLREPLIIKPSEFNSAIKDLVGVE